MTLSPLLPVATSKLLVLPRRGRFLRHGYAVAPHSRDDLLLVYHQTVALELRVCLEMRSAVLAVLMILMCHLQTPEP